MPYSDEEMEQIERDPVRLRCYFWRVAMNARRIAAKNRNTARIAGTLHSTKNYRPVFDEGYDLLWEASVLESFSAGIIDNIDVLVESTLEVDTAC